MSAHRSSTATLISLLRSMASTRMALPADLLDAAGRLEKLAPLELAAREFAEAEYAANAYIRRGESLVIEAMAKDRLFAAAREVARV